MKYYKKIKYLILILPVLFQLSCGEGITPEPETTQSPGFSGKITFIGAWPDSITRTHLVVFKNLLQSPGDFNILNLKFVGPEIPYGITEINYNSLDTAFIQITSGEYAYVCVAQSKTIDLSLNRIDWTVAGVYYANGDTTKPGTLVIPENTLLTNIDIICDFNNPPPQPPGGR